MLAKTKVLDPVTEAAAYHPHKEFIFACFGKIYNDNTETNWSFTPLQSAADVQANLELCSRLEDAFGALDARHVYAPSPVASNAQFVPREFLSVELPLSPRISLWRNKDAPGDVSELSPLEAGAFSAGGCPLIVAMHAGRCLYAHAGRDCLIDREYLREVGRRGRRLNESVVDTMMRMLLRGLHRSCEQDVRVWVFGSLPPEEYPHPLSGKWASLNKAMKDYVSREWGELGAQSTKERAGVIYFDLPLLIRAQFERWGVPEQNINIRNAYLRDKREVWLDGTKGAPRNLFVIKRHRT